MNDYVSKQAVIDYLMKNMNWYDEDDRMVDDWSVKEPIITELIKGVPTGWISVKERLPESAGQMVLVTAHNSFYNTDEVFPAFLAYGPTIWCTYDTIRMQKVTPTDNRVSDRLTITHWMPMPEPPKEDANETD